MRFDSLVILFFTLFCRPLFAETETICPAPKESNDILKCLQLRHPEVRSETVINEVSEKLASQGSSWRNPDISFDSVQGDNLGSQVVESEVRISQTIEVSGQRSARRNRGKALGLSFKADSLGKLENVTLNGIKSLYRLAQLREVIAVVEESVQRFRVIKNQYQSRPRLNPEQEVTLGIIQLAVSEYEIKLNHLSTEKRELISDMMASSGLSQTEIEKNLPLFKSDWPETPKIENSEIKSSAILKSQSDVDLALSDFEEAKAQAWPEFTVSLVAQDRIDGSLQYQLFGAGISMPLPLFQRNQGEKSLKASDYLRARKVHETNLKKQESSLEIVRQIYGNSVVNLKNTPSNQSVENKHKRTESLFAQGLISGPIFIESHKQRVDYMEARNEEELKALEALWTLYILNGNFLNQKI